MNIKEIPNGLEINVDSKEAVDYFLKLVLKQRRNIKPYSYSTAYTSNFRIDVRFINIPSKRAEKKRKAMLERAKLIKLIKFIEEFRLTGNKGNQSVVSQFCNVFTNYFRDRSLCFLIEHSKEDLLKFRRVGPKALDLFEHFLNIKKFELAV